MRGMSRSVWVAVILSACGGLGGFDDDTDGLSQPNLPTVADVDQDGYAVDVDCDDLDAAVNPGALEVPYDGADNDCNPWTPDDDLDRDGFGSAVDCDDDNLAVFPGANELCNSEDDDCNGLVDEDPVDGILWYPDADNDGFGAASAPLQVCDKPDGYAEVSGDCDDTDSTRSPGRLEICDGIDNDCDAVVDQGFGDSDNDGVADCIDVEACDGFDNDGDGMIDEDFSDIDNNGVPDCRDTERCDGLDNDGDGDTDEDFADTDGDGIADCMDVEVCDGVDNDGDGGIDEGTPDTDGDGVPDCLDVEVCDGVDNDGDGLTDEPDADDAPSWHPDPDGDGYGQQGTAANGIVSCLPVPGRAPNTLDCDESDALVNAGAPEVCGDGVDNDCDGIIDGASAWWDTDWPYRVMITVGAPPQDVASAPIAVDVDFGALLQTLDVPGQLNPSSLRVVHQSCVAGLPVVRHQWSDGVLGLFDAVPPESPLGDDHGTLAFLYDQDGDWATDDVMLGNSVTSYAVYFASTTDIGPYLTLAYPNAVDTLNNSLDNGLVQAGFDVGAGGLLDSFGLVGGPSLVEQVGQLDGNGLYAGDWVSAVSDFNGSHDVLASGPIFAVAQSQAVADDGVVQADVRTTWTVFAKRPELYAKMELTAASAAMLGPSTPSVVEALRPVQLGSALFAADPGVIVQDTVGGTWVHQQSGDGTWGFGFGWRLAPSYGDISIVGTDMWATAADGVSPSDGLLKSVTSGEVLTAWPVAVLSPHVGPWSVYDEAFFGTLNGPDLDVAPVQRLGDPVAP